MNDLKFCKRQLGAAAYLQFVSHQKPVSKSSQAQTFTMEISLYCLILGYGLDHAFDISVPDTADVDLLRQRLTETRAEIADVKSTKLELLWVNISLDDAESKLPLLDLDSCPTLFSLLKISALAPSDNCLHIVVIAPGTLHLSCAQVEAGEVDWTKVFSIDIDFRDNVSFLQQAVQAAQEPLFDGFYVYELALFKVSIFRDPYVRDGRFQAIDLGVGQRILPLERLSQLFPRVKKDELELQVVIQVPIDDEKKEHGRGRISSLQKRFEKVVSRISLSSSDISSAYTKTQLADCIYDGRYQEKKPKTNMAPPLQLFHPVFGHFLDDINGTDLISNDMIRKTTKYMQAASAIYISEEKCRHGLTTVLCEILGVETQTTVDGDEIITDGTILARTPEAGYLIILHQGTTGSGRSVFDQAKHAGLSMAYSWAQEKSTKLRNATNCPTFIVATSGPSIAILGAVFTDGFIVQHLTDYVWAGLDSTLYESRTLRIARTFHALNKGLANLKSYYGTVQTHNWISETRYFPSITTYPNGNECIHFKYLAFLEDGPDCMTLRARTLTVPPRDVVVKFVDRYGERAHRLLADKGLAPELLYCGSPHLQDKDPSYNSISMVVMEFVRGDTLDKSEMSGETAEVVRSEIERALKLLHGHGLVFGDLRAPNVMITPMDYALLQGNEVKFIDFDWAGEEGQAKYPCLISPEVLWPMGVAPLANMEINHDLQMLEQMFLPPVPFVAEDSASLF